jgi:hypothetical protein
MLLSIAHDSNSQELFKAGYILANNGDTIPGLLQEADKKNLLSEIKYKTGTVSTKVNTAHAWDIKGFGYVTGSVFKSVTLSAIADDTINFNKIFAEQLVEGTYELFNYFRNDQLVYLIKKDNQSYQLFNNTYLRSGELDEAGNYQNQLLFLSVPCKSTTLNIESISFDDKSMASFITLLNKCVSPGKKTITYKNKEKNKIEVIIFAGGLPFNGSLQIISDAFVSISNPRLKKNLYFNIGIHYSHGLFINTKRNSGNSLYQETTTNIIYSVPATIQFDFLSGKVRPYLAVGASCGILDKSILSYMGVDKTSNFNISGIGEFGIDANLTTNLNARAVWHYENFIHYPAIGIAYKFK